MNEQETAALKAQILKDKNLLQQKNTMGASLLHTAVFQGNTNLAMFLIDQGIDVNLQDENGDTALHYCAEHNRLEIAAYILVHNGRLDMADKHSNQPLWTAVSNDKGMNKRIEIVRLFLDHGADKEHANKVNRTPAFIAARYKNLSELFSL